MGIISSRIDNENQKKLSDYCRKNNISISDLIKKLILKEILKEENEEIKIYPSQRDIQEEKIKEGLKKIF
jgi:hypothetical protein